MEPGYLIMYLIVIPFTLLLLTVVGFVRSILVRTEGRKDLHRYLIDSLKNEDLSRVMAIYCYLAAMDTYRGLIHSLLLRRDIDPPADWKHITTFVLVVNLLFTEVVLQVWRYLYV